MDCSSRIRCRRRSRGASRYYPLLSFIVILDIARITCAFFSNAALPSIQTQSKSGRGRYRLVSDERGSREISIMVSSLAGSPRTKAMMKDEFFEVQDRMVKFGSNQYVETSIPGASLPSMQQYLSEPSRIIYASWDNKDIEPKGDGVFRMRVTSQSFLSVSIDMFVDLEVAVKGDGKIGCKSIGFSVDSMGKFLGQEFVDTFFLELDGELRVEETETKLRNLTLKQALLTGDVGVSIGGKMPLLLSATPEPLVKSASLGINNRVLEYVASTFVSTIARDYRTWAREQVPSSPPLSSPPSSS